MMTTLHSDNDNDVVVLSTNNALTLLIEIVILAKDMPKMIYMLHVYRFIQLIK